MKTKYVKETKYWVIRISRDEYSRYVDLIQANRDIRGELLGMLIGKAKPLRKYTLCKHCGKKIAAGDLCDVPFRSGNWHKDCDKEAERILIKKIS